MFPLYPILKSFHYNRTHHCSSVENQKQTAKYQRFSELYFSVDDILEPFIDLMNSLISVTENDPRIISLLLTILMFYEGLSMNEDKPLFKDGKWINRSQSYYTKILWKYMIHKWNEEETCKRFIRFLPVLFQIESSAKRYREYFRDQLTQANVVDQLIPLVQGILHIF